jgi:uncharacterized membrane protein
MNTQRLEAFTDGVIAIVITIMVLDIRVPAGAALRDLRGELPLLFVYALSYANVGIFWNNHHHTMHATDRIDGRVLWVNLVLLFWLSLVPLAIRWIDSTHFAALPTAMYGVILALAAIAYYCLELDIIRCNGPDSKLARAVGSQDTKALISLAIYAAAVPIAFYKPWLALACYMVNALVWIRPDKRIEAIAEP